MSQMYADLVAAMSTVVKLHNEGRKQLLVTKSVPELKLDVAAGFVEEVAKKIFDYNEKYKIWTPKLDLTKVLTFTAAVAYKTIPGFSARPLFYKYITFLDTRVYHGHQLSLHKFGDSRFFAHNLDQFLAQDQWLAPFCWFRAIDLCMDKCSIPRVDELLLKAREQEREIFHITQELRLLEVLSDQLKVQLTEVERASELLVETEKLREGIEHRDLEIEEKDRQIHALQKQVRDLEAEIAELKKRLEDSQGPGA